jgi:hypothetical protein
VEAVRNAESIKERVASSEAALRELILKNENERLRDSVRDRDIDNLEKRGKEQMSWLRWDVHPNGCYKAASTELVAKVANGTF